MQGPTKISPEERKRLDRQRFLGLETQKKLLNSKILITPANGPNTQLAKNLVLAGVNVALYDDAIVTKDDFQTNFLIGLDQIKLNRGEVIFNKLKQMNPSGSNQFYPSSLDISKIGEEFFNQFTIICTSFNDFSLVAKWDEITKKCNKPYYNMFSAGAYAFCYVSLGSNYIYKQPPTKSQARQFSIKSLNLEQATDRNEVLKSKKRQVELLQAIIMMKQSQQRGLSYDVFKSSKSDQQMLHHMIDLGNDIKQTDNIDFLTDFAKYYGIEYCPVYSVIGSIVSQEIIKVVQNQQEPAVNWIVMNSEQGYACVLKLKKQDQHISSKIIENQN